MAQVPYYYHDPNRDFLFRDGARLGEEKVAPFAEQHDHDQTFNMAAWKALDELRFWEILKFKKGVHPFNKWFEMVAQLEGLASTAQDAGFVVAALSQAAFVMVIETFSPPFLSVNHILDRLAAGMVTATAIAEPHTGTDTRNLQTIALPNGDHWLLNGVKTNISLAPQAELILVLGRMPGKDKKDQTLFLLNKEKHSWEVGPTDDKLGCRSLPTATVTFRDVVIRQEDILGKPGEGMEAMLGFMGYARALYGMLGPILLTPAMERAKAYLQERQSGGKNLSQHQHIQRKIAECMIGMEQSKWMAIGAIGQVIDGLPEAAMSSSVAKITGMRNMERMARDILSIFGSEGYKDPYLGRIVRDSMAWMNMGGTEEAHLMNIFHQWAKGVGV